MWYLNNYKFECKNKKKKSNPNNKKNNSALNKFNSSMKYASKPRHLHKNIRTSLNNLRLKLSIWLTSTIRTNHLIKPSLLRKLWRSPRIIKREWEKCKMSTVLWVSSSNKRKSKETRWWNRSIHASKSYKEWRKCSCKRRESKNRHKSRNRIAKNNLNLKVSSD